MKLICTKQELDELITHNIVEPKGNGEFLIYAKANLMGVNHSIDIVIDNIDKVTRTSPAKVEASKKIVDDNKTLSEWYDELRDVFPTDTEKPFGREGGRNLRSGSKDLIITRLAKLQDTGYSLRAVVNAAKYDVWYRINSSLGDNKLEFMQGLVAWLNNTGNIDAMIDRGLNSSEFQAYLENNNGENNNTAREIKLA